MAMDNEKRLTDAGAFERYLMVAAPEDGVCDDCLQYVTDELMTYPAADAVEVVRCRDCKWYRYGEYFDDQKFCYRLKHPDLDKRVGYNFSPDDYCSYGERRCEDGET